MQCRECGIYYRDFRTGLTYRQVYHLIFDRKYKRRRGVLGAWRQFKRELWEQHKEHCRGEVEDCEEIEDEAWV